MRELIDSLPFEIDSRVPIQLGRESISSSVVAVSELVKNSYDADAKCVEVCFENLIASELEEKTQGDTILIIKDDGDGMTQERLTNYWLRIGTDCKADASRSQNGRILTGAKGLGRLGIDRLCNKLVLLTKQSGMEHFLELHVEWDKYVASSKPLSEIRHDVFRTALGGTDNYYQVFTTTESSGTCLIMQGLKDQWSSDFIEELKKELSLLVSPFGGVNDFKIKLTTGDPELDGLLSGDEMLKAADWIVDANLSDKGEMSVTIKSDRYGDIHDEGKHQWNDWISGYGKQAPCGPFKFVLYFIPRDTHHLKSLDFTVTKRKEFMEANNGIRIYRDHFRVRPYGEPSGKGDWLDLGLRRAKRPEAMSQKGWKVGPHQIVGAIFISRESNLNLVDQTNREGIVEGQGYFSLRAAILKIIERFEVIAHDKAVELNEPKASVQAKGQADIARAVAREKASRLKDQVAKAVSGQDSSESKGLKLEDLARAVEEIASSIEEVATATEEADKIYANEARELEIDKDTLANLASLGILTVCFGHEAKEYSNLAAANAVLLKQNFDNGHLQLMPPYDDRFTKSIDIILESTHFVRNFAGFALGNVRADKRKQKNLELSEVIHSVFSAMEGSLIRQNISVDVSEVEKVSVIRAFRIDWESIIINLLTNSVTAMQDTPAEKRQVSVSLKEENDSIILNFADSGCGLESGTEGNIFVPMFSTKRDMKGNVDGTGMGLSIVKNFIKEHSGGDISVSSPGKLGGAEFRIKVPILARRKEK